MKYVIILFFLLSFGCHPKSEYKPTPNPLALPSYEPKGEPIFHIHVKEDSLFHENKKIEKDEIKTLFKKVKNNNKKKEKPVIGIKTGKNAKTENVVFLLELGRAEGIDLVLNFK